MILNIGNDTKCQEERRKDERKEGGRGEERKEGKNEHGSLGWSSKMLLGQLFFHQLHDLDLNFSCSLSGRLAQGAESQKSLTVDMQWSTEVKPSCNPPMPGPIMGFPLPYCLTTHGTMCPGRTKISTEPSCF